MSSHRLPITIFIGGDSLELTAEIEFSIRPGSPASWTDPGDPAEIELESVDMVTKDSAGRESFAPAPDWLRDFLANSDAVYLALGEASDWGENDGPDADDLRDERRDAKLTAPGQT